MAPDLVQIQRYFAGDGVVFISLSPGNEADARKFAVKHDFSWLVGWGADEIVKRFFTDRYPAVVVVGRDGKIVWNDGTSRLRHLPEEGAAELFEHIRRAISASRGHK